SIVLPTTMPTPMAEPIEARPKASGTRYPTMFTWVPFLSGVGFRRVPGGSVLVCQRELDVDGGEEGEDVGLQHGDHQLEEREDHGERERADAEEADQLAVGEEREEEEVRGREAQHEQQVARDHVHQESEGQGDRTQDEDREQL